MIYHSKCLDHNVPEWHLETPDRLSIAIEIIRELERNYDSSKFYVVGNPTPDPTGPVSDLLDKSASFFGPNGSPSSNPNLTASRSLYSSFIANPSPYLSYEPLSFQAPSLPQSSFLELSQQLPSINHVASSLSISSLSRPPITTSLPKFKLVSSAVLEACHDPQYLLSIKSKVLDSSLVLLVAIS